MKGLATELEITIDEEAAKKLGERSYVNKMILGETHIEIAIKCARWQILPSSETKGCADSGCCKQVH